MTSPAVVVEPWVVVSALLAACVAMVIATAPAPVPALSSPRGNAGEALGPVMSIRFDVEATWLLDPQLCLQAFVWFHTEPQAMGELGLVRCWR